MQVWDDIIYILYNGVSIEKRVWTKFERKYLTWKARWKENLKGSPVKGKESTGMEERKEPKGGKY